MTNARGLRRLAGAMTMAALTAATLLVTATAAQAQINVDVSDNTVTHEDEIHATGTVPSGTTHVTLAECGIDGAVTAADLGRRCNFDTSVGFTAAATFTTSGQDIDVWSWFDDFDFVAFDDPDPATETHCLDVDEGEHQCAVVLSAYTVTPNPPGPPTVTFLDADAEEITFE